MQAESSGGQGPPVNTGPPVNVGAPPAAAGGACGGGIHMDIHTFHTCMREYIQGDPGRYTYMYAWIHAYIHTYTHTYTRIHLYMFAPRTCRAQTFEDWGGGKRWRTGTSSKREHVPIPSSRRTCAPTPHAVAPAGRPCGRRAPNLPRSGPCQRDPGGLVGRLVGRVRGTMYNTEAHHQKKDRQHYIKRRQQERPLNPKP